MILICEPQCWDFEHHVFNAALLQTALFAFPDSALVFAAESSHLEIVRRTLGRYGSGQVDRISWREMPIADRRGQGSRRVSAERETIGRVLDMARETAADSLLLSSISEAGLMALKWRLWGRDAPRIPAVVVLHGMLSSLLAKGSRRPLAWAFHLRQVLRLPHPKQLHYVALGGHIQQTLRLDFPNIANHFSPMDHPWLWTRARPADRESSGAPVRFGYFGAAYKGGLEHFHRLAQAVHRESHSAEFLLIGFAGDGERARYGDDVLGIGSTPLTADEYDRRAASIDYAVWTANPGSYRLAASASFLDALSYVKPGFYLRSDYVEHYFRQMGDIGCLCGTYDELEGLARSVASTFPTDQYRQQCENILRGRTVFDPATVAGQLRSIVTACQNSLAS